MLSRSLLSLSKTFVSALLLASLFGCSSDDTKETPKDAGFQDTGVNCGTEGDQGNSLGIGKYCTLTSECADTTGAPICATAGNPGAKFCTTYCTCTAPDGAPLANQCGDGATCTCDERGCGCTPNKCLTDDSKNCKPGA